VEDVKCAIRFLRANAKKYGIDPDRIGAIGDSAGGHLSMMLAVTRPEDGLEGNGGWPGVSSAVQAAVSFYGPADLAAADAPELAKPILRNFFGDSPNLPEIQKKASPITYVHAKQPPILLLQGTIDPLVTTSQAVRMAAAMSNVGAPGRVEILIGAGHGFTGEDRSDAIEATVAFFEKHLRTHTSGK
jgi:acetyl esterase/lipase